MASEKLTCILSTATRTIAEYVGFIVANINTGGLDHLANLIKNVKYKLIVILVVRTCVIRKPVTRNLCKVGMSIKKIVICSILF